MVLHPVMIMRVKMRPTLRKGSFCYRAGSQKRECDQKTAEYVNDPAITDSRFDILQDSFSFILTNLLFQELFTQRRFSIPGPMRILCIKPQKILAILSRRTKDDNNPSGINPPEIR